MGESITQLMQNEQNEQPMPPQDARPPLSLDEQNAYVRLVDFCWIGDLDGARKLVEYEGMKSFALVHEKWDAIVGHATPPGQYGSRLYQFPDRGLWVAVANHHQLVAEWYFETFGGATEINWRALEFTMLHACFAGAHESGSASLCAGAHGADTANWVVERFHLSRADVATTLVEFVDIPRGFEWYVRTCADTDFAPAIEKLEYFELGVVIGRCFAYLHTHADLQAGLIRLGETANDRLRDIRLRSIRTISLPRMSFSVRYDN